jgi:(p)ppGpp synthase/HD superfamily hydrolase
MSINFHGYSDRINHALAYASLHPVGHLRKGTRVPYITHLASVALILARYERDEDTIVGGILHDVVEDCNDEGHTRHFHARQISEKFGPKVLQIVLDVTHTAHDSDGNKLSSEARKVMYLEHLAVASDKARWVSAADKLHNARSILSDLARASKPSDVWCRFNVGRDATIHWYRRVYARLVEVGFDGDILPELLDAVECLEATMG